MGRFMCNNDTCRKQFWNSRKVPIEIRGFDNNGYIAIVYNQRCKSCDWLGTFELDEQSYIERVAYRLKKWAGVEMEAPPINGTEGPPHERAYCEGCKRGKCREGVGFGLYQTFWVHVCVHVHIWILCICVWDVWGPARCLDIGIKGLGKYDQQGDRVKA